MEAVSILLFVLQVLLWFLAITAGVLLAALLLVLALVLFLPFRFRARAEGALHPDEEGNWDGHARWETTVRWGLILLRVFLRGTHKGVDEMTVSVFGLRFSLGKGKEKPAGALSGDGEKKPEKKKKKKKQKRKQPVTFEDLKAYAHEGLRLVRRLWAALRLHVEGDLRFGFEDPSLTGFTLAVLSVTGRPADLRVRPDWLEPGVEGWLSLRGKVYGFEVALALWSAYWRSPLGRRLRQRLTFRFRKQRVKQEVEYHGRAG
ncbi:MAG TPA: hypothetical protein VNT75_17730 [Symbiobacteriaceae bacterium]|nr:hypothetical protein [Symbiobacteriaceae bacterium]